MSPKSAWTDTQIHRDFECDDILHNNKTEYLGIACHKSHQL